VIISGDALTVFAPTNDAFARLPSSVVSKLTHDKNLLTGETDFKKINIKLIHEFL
jgi:uncharacterized surface protein with fasciclin (FAS1) repeats